MVNGKYNLILLEVGLLYEYLSTVRKGPNGFAKLGSGLFLGYLTWLRKASNKWLVRNLVDVSSYVLGTGLVKDAYCLFFGWVG